MVWLVNELRGLRGFATPPNDGLRLLEPDSDRVRRMLLTELDSPFSKLNTPASSLLGDDPAVSTSSSSSDDDSMASSSDKLRARSEFRRLRSGWRLGEPGTFRLCRSVLGLVIDSLLNASEGALDESPAIWPTVSGLVSPPGPGIVPGVLPSAPFGLAELLSLVRRLLRRKGRDDDAGDLAFFAPDDTELLRRALAVDPAIPLPLFDEAAILLAAATLAANWDAGTTFASHWPHPILSKTQFFAGSPISRAAMMSLLCFESERWPNAGTSEMSWLVSLRMGSGPSDRRIRAILEGVICEAAAIPSGDDVEMRYVSSFLIFSFCDDASFLIVVLA